MKKSILQVRRSVKKINLSNIEHSFDHTFIGTFIVNIKKKHLIAVNFQNSKYKREYNKKEAQKIKYLQN
jgi:hypothetical protein